MAETLVAEPSVEITPQADEDTADLAALAARTIRGLAIDAVQAAESGHPGLPMGMADVATVLWTKFLKHNPKDPHWPDRDRFVLSAGHGSMLLYSLLHLSGYDLPLTEIRNFRQLKSKTPGHPENFVTVGVETTTGPLGQGLSNAIGMAVAEKHLAAVFNTDEHTVVDHHTYVIASDGDLMEGVTNEASSLAGHLGLGKLIVFWDDNSISIDGSTELAFTEDVPARYRALGWHVIGPIDGHDRAAVEDAIREAQAETDRPTLIDCKTTIGFGSPNRAGTAKAHGEPLGEEEVALTKENLGIPLEPKFFVPDGGDRLLKEQAFSGMEAHCKWSGVFNDYKESHPDKAAEFERRFSGELPDDWDSGIPEFEADAKGLATRAASGKVLEAITQTLPELIGGSADLSGSVKTETAATPHLTVSNPGGRYVHYGVREHAMGSIMNGFSLHGGVRGYGGTFLIFYDYMRPPVRLAALMRINPIYVFTHDSIGLGEDGPTHQPVEQLAGLRSVPNCWVVRPADANETAEAWRVAINRTDGPTALALTRQNVPTLDRSRYASAEGVRNGGYILSEADGTPDVILIGTGSEVHLALEAQKTLVSEGIRARVVSLPCWGLFDQQDVSYRNEVLPAEITARVAVEAGTPFGWERYVGLTGKIVGIDRFGESAPYQEIYQSLGITAEAVVEAAKMLL